MDPLLLQRAVDLHRRNQLEAAEPLYRQVLARDARQPEALRLLGVLLLQSGRAGEAVDALRAALALRPQSPHVLAPLGEALVAGGRHAEAATAYAQLSSLLPGEVEPHLHLGHALFETLDYEQALQAYERALALRPNGPRILYSSANALMELGRFDEALARYDRSIQADPGFDAAYARRGILKLLLGDLAGGWPDYERRRPPPEQREVRPQVAPDWKGEDPQGRSILVSDASGLGDAIQFIRYLPMLAARGARVSFLGNPRLFRLFEPLAGSVRLLATLPPGERFDYHCKLLSLPALFDTRMDTIPCPVPYLQAEAGRVQRWRERVGAHGFRIGIVWKGNPSRVIDGGRSVPLACYAPLARLPGVRLISLQKRYGLEQLSQLPEGMRVESPGEDLDEGEHAFLDTAALMQHLDLVVSSDTSMIHLAGALGRPAFLALKFVPEWRWFLGRDDTPWYPSVRLFRQPVLGDWDSAFEAMAAAIARRLPAATAN